MLCYAVLCPRYGVTLHGTSVEVWYAVLCPRYGVTLHGTFRVRLCIPALCLGLLQVELIEGVVVFFFGGARRGRVFMAPPPTIRNTCHKHNNSNRLRVMLLPRRAKPEQAAIGPLSSTLRMSSLALQQQPQRARAEYIYIYIYTYIYMHM